MGQADQFAKRVFEEETEASTQGCAHWLGPMEVPSSHVVVDGLIRVVNGEGMAKLQAPWCLLAESDYVVVEVKMPGDHVDWEEWVLAQHRRTAVLVKVSKEPEGRKDRLDVQLMLVSPHLPEWVKPWSSVALSAGCYAISKGGLGALWVVANELPMGEGLFPFLVVRSGRKRLDFLHWAMGQKDEPWLLFMLESVSMTKAEQMALFSSRMPSPEEDPEAQQRWLTISTNLLEMMRQKYPEGVEELLHSFPPEMRLAGLAPQERLAGLDEAHAVLALPVGVIRGLSKEYIDSLPEDVKILVLKRLAESV
jgi:hypothetical protein